MKNKARIFKLHDMIMAQVTDDCASCFAISKVKEDGTVRVRFRSTPKVPAIVYARRFCVALEGSKLHYAQPAKCSFRLAIDQLTV